MSDTGITGSVSVLLGETTKALAAFLEKVLPPLFDDWWNKAVVNFLSYQQAKRLEQNNVTSLGGLDLAALLRVLVSNWYQISRSQNFPPEALHYVKEMQTIRNRWAHADAEGFPADDMYRDLDTLQRFAVIVGADDRVIDSIKGLKGDLFAAPTEAANSTPEQLSTSGEDNSGEVEFALAQIVVAKANPAMRGPVIEILPGKPENRFKVFTTTEVQIFYASQLQAEDQPDEKEHILPCDQFHAHLTALQIKYPALSTLYSLNAARVDFIPYQFRPVLRFIRSDRPRLLIADGVGVGKTIEAGLILRELQARREIRSVLIICPRSLVTEKKWQNEMKRFDERFTHLDGNSLRYCINEMDLDGAWPEQYKKCIIPYSQFDEVLLHGSGSESKRKKTLGLLDLDPPPRFDLVIVDEAHHIRNSNTFRHEAVKFFCDNAEAVVFLTATPIQLGNRDLYVLLNVLRPDLIIDPESFTHMSEPNPFINQAVSAMRSQIPEWQSVAVEALDQAAATSWGQSILRHSPNFSKVRTQLTEETVSHEQRVKMISDTEAMHTFSNIINRTRRRDIGNFTVRKPETVLVPFTPDQEFLHNELLRIQSEIFSQVHGRVSVNFLMTTIRRQAASCLYGLAPLLDEILNRHLDELSWAEVDNTEFLAENDVNSIKFEVKSLLEIVRSIDPEDPKLEALRRIVRDKQSLPNNKIMLFSSFRHTLHYLFDHLREDGFRVGLVHGGTPDEERVAMRARFEKPKEDPDCIDLLLFSEIGCEGLDYQFCDCMVNYDLPWNPLRVEQRIGRIDRKGQKSESVAIVNLVTPGTVDADIYDRCLMRIGVFNNALGGSEEILGEITREIKNIAENYQLTEQERKEKLQQLSDNKIRLMQEQEDLEQKQVELFGIHLPQEQMNQEITDAASFWLAPTALRRLITLYLQRICGKDLEFILGEKPLKILRLAQDYRDALLEDFQRLPRQNTSTYREWENWLKGGNQHLNITFEADCAAQNPQAAFIMPLHPLVKQAALSFDTKKRHITNLTAVSSTVPAGSYEFAIYQWRYHGVKEDLVLMPVASDDVVTKHLNRLLENAKDAPDPVQTEFAAQVWDTLDAVHYRTWSEAKEKHRQDTQELTEYRRESLSTSHRARIALHNERLRQISDDKIQRMHKTQISKAEADYARRIQELDIALERADIVTSPVAYGVIHISEGS